MSDLQLHNGEILVMNQRIMTVSLAAETSRYSYTIRLWPNGMMQKLLNWGVITMPTVERTHWRGAAVLRLELAYAFCRPSMLLWVNKPMDTELYYKMVDRLVAFNHGDRD